MNDATDSEENMDDTEAHQIDRHWMAVDGDQIAALADTKERAACAADHLGQSYTEVVATPKNGVPNFI